MLYLRNRYGVFFSVSILFLVTVTYYWHTGSDDSGFRVDKLEPARKPYHPKYKPASTTKTRPIKDNFPLAAAAHSPADLPSIPPWNTPPSPHIPESTPLFIGFTRNWRLLQQVVVSYITAGWPPEDIYVVENTGVMDSNKNGLLGLQNPFFLNHTRLHLLGVNVVVTPTLFTFAQLQNFYIYHAVQQKWGHFFWSHMDIVALSFEDRYVENHPDSRPETDKYEEFVSVYKACYDTLRTVLAPDPKTNEPVKWAQRFFSYDRLALVNVQAFLDIGAWDTMIPFYMTDCDMHARLEMAGYVVEEVPVGLIFDVASSLEDLLVLYRKTGDNVPEVKWKDPNAEEPKEESRAREVKGKGKGKGSKREAEVYSATKGSNTTYEQWMEIAAGNPDSNTGEDEESKSKSNSELKPKDPPPPTYFTNTSPPSELSPPLKPSSSSQKQQQQQQQQQQQPPPPPTTNPLFKSDAPSSPLFWALKSTLDAIQGSKGGSPNGRNTWQARQTGGQGEPFYRDSEGFQRGIDMTIEFGRRVYAEKWGHRDCDIAPLGMRISDAWAVEHDWEEVTPNRR